MGNLRDASELLWPAVSEAIASLELGSEHAAAKKLAQRYAQIIDAMPDQAPRGQPDQAWAARWLFPLLLGALTELGATPAAKAAIAKGSKDKHGTPAPKNQLEIMRENRARGRA